MNNPNVLDALGLRKDWIYETIISTYSRAKAHSAPIGVSTPDNECIVVEIYKTSETCANILSNKVFSVNLPSDISLFYDSSCKKEALVYGRANKINAPILAGAGYSLEVSVLASVDLGDRMRFTGSIVGHSSAKQPGAIKLINRGDALALEALIAATKIPYASGEEKELLIKEIRRISRVVGRVAPGSNAEKLVDGLSLPL
jgi:hypothetical protein